MDSKGSCAENLVFSTGEISYIDRCDLLKQHGLVVWFTGMSGAGKSTIAIAVESELIKKGVLTYRLDGDNIRHGLCSDLDFSEADRFENVRRIAEVALLLKDIGIVTLVSLITPFQKMRDSVKEKIGVDSFIEVYVKADIDTCIERDPKGLYKKAKESKIKEFTGISSPYEEPINPNILLDTTELTIDECKNIIVNAIINNTNKI